jgi:hypothetical protein
MHELVHAMGFVPASVPGSGLNGHFTTDKYDLMYAGDSDWGYIEKELTISELYKNELAKSPYFA